MFGADYYATVLADGTSLIIAVATLPGLIPDHFPSRALEDLAVGPVDSLELYGDDRYVENLDLWDGHVVRMSVRFAQKDLC